MIFRENNLLFSSALFQIRRGQGASYPAKKLGILRWTGLISSQCY